MGWRAVTQDSGTAAVHVGIGSGRGHTCSRNSGGSRHETSFGP